MGDSFDIYTIIFLVLAVFVLFRLRSVLGTRTGNERPPYDPYAARREDGTQPASAAENVVSLPSRGRIGEPAASAGASPRNWSDIAKPGTRLADGLSAIVALEPQFDPRDFLKGAEMAYEMIVTAFAAGDRATLKPLLSVDVFEGFDAAISEREGRGETMSTTFVSIDTVEMMQAELREGLAHITVRFIAQTISAIQNKDGSPREDVQNDGEVTELIDVWTFARKPASADPTWKLVATEAA